MTVSHIFHILTFSIVFIFSCASFWIFPINLSVSWLILFFFFCYILSVVAHIQRVVNFRYLCTCDCPSDFCKMGSKFFLNPVFNLYSYFLYFPEHVDQNYFKFHLTTQMPESHECTHAHVCECVSSLLASLLAFLAGFIIFKWILDIAN